MKRFVITLVVAILGMSGYAYACKTQVIDVCPNVEEVQSEVPEGYHLDDNKDCVVDEVVQPVETPPVEVQSVDDTPLIPPANFQGK